MVASKLRELQERVFCFVSPDNEASLSMLTKLGFQRIGEMDWIVLE